MTITAFDGFCGAGGSSTGMVAAGVEVRHAANHWALAIETHSANHPRTEHYIDDLQQAHPSWYPRTDIAWFSPECFPAGTLILTTRGLIPIEEISVGDEVLTHLNRWRPVTQVISSINDTIILKGHGHNTFEVTPNHPIYVREQRQIWNNEIRRYKRNVSPKPQWINAGDIPDTATQNWYSPDFRAFRWATPLKVPTLPTPIVKGRGMDMNTCDFWWLIGRWLGDGSLRLRRNHRKTLPKGETASNRPYPSPCINCGQPSECNARYPHIANYYCANCLSLAGAGSEIHISCGKHEVEYLREKLSCWKPGGKRAGFGELRWSITPKRTAHVFIASHSGFAEWLYKHFGHYAYAKTIPTWLLGTNKEFRQAVLDGYVSADGHVSDRSTHVTTVSKNLALGIRLLAESLGFRVSMSKYATEGEAIIEGRHVRVRDQWVLRWENNASDRESETSEYHAWTLIKSVNPGDRNRTVFNLSVGEDESYVADGIVVHNCTSHSLAKGRRRKGINQLSMWDKPMIDPAEERSRATMREVVEFTEYHLYEIVIVENVVDIRLWQFYEDWYQAMENLGYHGQTLYLNAQFFGVPQSRDRWYTVFWKKGNRAPDLRFRPTAHCPDCDEEVAAIQCWKKSDFPWGRYGANRQYVYRCPRCAGEVFPPTVPAYVAIDWTIPAQKIGDRAKPLKPKTIERIQAGLRKFAQKPILVDLGHTHAEHRGKVTAADHPLPTQTTRQTLALAVPPFLMSYYTRDNAQSGIDQPIPTIPTENRHSLVIPPFTISLNHTTNRLCRVDKQPLDTVMPQTSPYLTIPPFITPLRGTAVSKGIDVPLTTIIASAQQHALIVPPGFVMAYYGGNPVYKRIDEPLSSLTTVQRHALIEPESLIDDCRFRMLEPEELKRGMSFPDEYIILGSKRNQVRQIGNAVCCHVAEAITLRCVESLS